ncbi:ribosome recycling factor [bacterium]|nr:ribosome recycling factor [bacterium]
MEKTIADTEKKMEKTIESISHQLARLRTGKASTALLDGIKVDYYGTPTPINQLASISVPEPRLIVIHPWDKTAVSAVERAIQSSDLGLNPSSDGTVVRIPIPVLSEERRKELVKIAKGIAEDSKVAIRNIRRDIIEDTKQKQKDGDIPEDDSYRLQEKIQELTEKFSKEIDEIFKSKEDEILTV